MYKRDVQSKDKDSKSCFLDKMHAKKKKTDMKSSALKVQSGYLDRLSKHKRVEFNRMQKSTSEILTLDEQLKDHFKNAN